MVSGAGSTGSTPAPAVGAGAGSAGGSAGPTTTPGFGRRGGLALDLRRHEESQRLLKIDWTHPAVLELKTDVGPTSSEQRMFALDRETALARLTAKDPRPLLLLRECEHCKGTEHALLSRTLDNERIQLMLRFFHCVKFRPNVLDAEHTYRRLFDEKNPAHLMLLAADGQRSYTFDGKQEQRDLQAAMQSLLAASYERSADQAVTEVLKLMTRYDVLDLDRKALSEELESELEKDGPRSRRAGALAQKLERVRKQITALRDREAEILDLRVKREKL